MMETLELIGAVVGLVYLYLEYRASIYLWIAGIIMPAIYLVVYYEAGLYADLGINIYYLAAAVYGWLAWKKKSPDKRQELPITRMPRRWLLPLTALFVLAFLFITWLLIRFTDSNVPVWDAFTTALSIVGMWMLARKWLEQWLSWIAVDVVSAGLYLYKDLPATAALYALYAVVAWFGYRKWQQMTSYNT
ncbi:MAG: nicotinamide riboside transporter PnuC [Prevotellaceae bacterium]|jgi:nicotinamide mononucleotide transporter|nr:nicotinamide riboside transporter PnuC [Prevotellaceae bacterium]